MSSKLPDVLDITMGKIRDMVDANTIVGDPITTPDGVTIIPVSSVKVGFASGGSDFTTKHSSADMPFGGGAGAGVTVTPVAFLVVKDGNVRMLPVADAEAPSSLDRIMDMIPEIAQKVQAFLDERKQKKAEKAAAEAADAAAVAAE